MLPLLEGHEGRPPAAGRRRGRRGEALATLVVNTIRGIAGSRPSRRRAVTRRKAMLQDTCPDRRRGISDEVGLSLEKATRNSRRRKKIVVERRTPRSSTARRARSRRIERIRKQVEEATPTTTREAAGAHEAGGVAELCRRCDRSRDEGEEGCVEDALHATRAAVEGCGSVAAALIRAQKAIEKLQGKNEDQNSARSWWLDGEPLRQIVANAGEDAAVVLAKARQGKGTFGYNALQPASTATYSSRHPTRPRSRAWRCRTRLRSPACCRRRK
jgi:chaperonin GroEL